MHIILTEPSEKANDALRICLLQIFALHVSFLRKENHILDLMQNKSETIYSVRNKDRTHTYFFLNFPPHL